MSSHLFHAASPARTFNDFVSNFVKWSERWMPNLALDVAELMDGYFGLAQLTLSLEDVSSVFLEIEAVQTIATMISKVHGYLNGPEALDYKRLVTDIFFFACLVPTEVIQAPKHYYSLYSYTTAISRFAIRPISPTLSEALLREAQGIVSYGASNKPQIDCSRTSLLSHLDMNRYRTSSLLQRMTWLSLSHLVLPIRIELLKEEKPEQSLFLRVMNSPRLDAWMLSCSNAEEQYFLNTCDVAASLSSIVSLHPNIASLIHLSNRIYNDVCGRLVLAAKELPAYPVLIGSAPSQYDFSKSLLEDFRRNMDELEADVLTILDNEISPTRNTGALDSTEGLEEDQTLARSYPGKVDMKLVLSLYGLITRWHKQMQLLSSIFFPDSPVVLTPKIFANDWHKSAKCMTALALFDQLIPGRPTFLCRSQASRTLEQISCYRLHTHIALIESEADKGLWLEFPWNVEEENSPDIRKSILSTLWRRILLLDGALISSRESLFFGYWTIGHLSYWKAVRLGPKESDKYFLVSDPELCYFKLLSINQAVSFVANIQNLVNPTDGTVVQHYRTMRLRNEDH